MKAGGGTLKEEQLSVKQQKQPLSLSSRQTHRSSRIAPYKHHRQYLNLTLLLLLLLYLPYFSMAAKLSSPAYRRTYTKEANAAAVLQLGTSGKRSVVGLSGKLSDRRVPQFALYPEELLEDSLALGMRMQADSPFSTEDLSNAIK